MRLLSIDAHAGRSAAGVHLSITSPNKVAVWRSASLGPSGFTAELRAGVKHEAFIF